MVKLLSTKYAAGRLISWQRNKKKFRYLSTQESGFGLIEVIVAAMLLLIFSLVILSSSLASMTASVFAKEHSTATSLITTTAAEAEAAGYSTIAAGPSNTQPSPTLYPEITNWTSAGTQCTYDYSTISYTSPCSAGGGGFSYFSQETIANTVYTIYALPELSGTLITLTIYVTWSNGTATPDHVSGVTQITK